MTTSSHSIEQAGQHHPLWLDNFIASYQQLSIDNLHLLDNVYHADVIFIDPIQALQGRDALRDYFDHLYSNLSLCRFRIEQVIVEGDQAAIYWQMRFCHPKLNKGNIIELDGSSQLQGIDDKVVYHRDFVDLGAMLYEHLPFIGKLIAFIKKRAARHD
ncbi:nuclear transport factor 2 family protein [Litorilituus sediminis]|uniref:Nuclear transport factor 2 family protein n=1 Tax=Litorilituus sediminis TaxID=718192 RepID=A0A4V0ZGH4_9GAMM|nr:nuclear transport factor 2 family protein [Litorilituus sediminis]QBG37310.1 nuclear transport factor 2 family protein [Litorilituus sediminis]